MSTTQEFRSREPLAIVSGVRTPFAKAFTGLAHTPADELGRHALTAVLQRAGLTAEDVDEVVFGNVAGPPESANVARVIALRSGVPTSRVAHTVNRNCASGMESIITAWQAIRDRDARCVVAGGTESMSSVPLLYRQSAKQWFMGLRRAKGLAWWGHLLGLRPAMFKPVVGLELGLTDPTCGLNMGQTAEILAQEFGIDRHAQDEFAMVSHHRAVAAWDRCFLGDEVAPMPELLDKDTGPRKGQSIEALAKLKPLFDRDEGTITAGNSCPLTDGAAATVVMPARYAHSLGLRPLGYLRGYSVAGCDPRRMGLGPVFAISKLLRQSGMSLSDFELFEINEAFAAQVLACLKALESKQFAQQHLDRLEAVGAISHEVLNVNGGAIALGHPVGSSGTRLAITLLRALREQGKRRGLASLCVGGGQGYALWLETEWSDD